MFEFKKIAKLTEIKKSCCLISTRTEIFSVNSCSAVYSARFYIVSLDLQKIN